MIYILMYNDYISIIIIVMNNNSYFNINRKVHFLKIKTIILIQIILKIKSFYNLIMIMKYIILITVIIIINNNYMKIPRFLLIINRYYNYN